MLRIFVRPRRVSSVDGDGNDRSQILSAADFPAFGARCRRGCLCDGRALVSADAPGRGNQQHQSRAVNHSGGIPSSFAAPRPDAPRGRRDLARFGPDDVHGWRVAVLLA